MIGRRPNGWRALAGALVLAAAMNAGHAMAQSSVQVAPGVELNLVETGEETAAPALVLLPGWSTGGEIWQAQIDRFARDRRVLAVDPRSQGRSTVTQTGNTPETRARDLHALLTGRGVVKPVLVGWSQGVQDIAAYVALYGADDLAGIVLVDAAVSDGAQGITERPAEAAGQLALLALYDAHQPEYVRGFLEAIITRPQPDETIDRLAATAMRTPPSIGVAMLVADLFGEDRTGALDRIRCPTLIIASASSPELARQRAMAARIEGARFETMADAGHAVFIDQPERFNALLADFLATLPGGAGR